MKTGGFAQSIFKASSRQMEELGTIVRWKDGRVFAYAKAGASNLAAGKLTQSAAPDSNALNKAVGAAVAVGGTQITVTFGGAVTENAYKDGYMHVNDANGEGYIYRVKGHPAGTSSVPVDLYDPIRYALVASTSEVTFTKHPQDSVVVFPASQTSGPAGVPIITVPAGSYFWNQVKGFCPVLGDGTLVVGNMVIPSASVAGAVKAAETTEIVGPVGKVYQVNATTEYSLIMLAIPGY